MSTRALAIVALSFTAFAASVRAQDATPATTTSSARWAWLAAKGGTYWYVPSTYLPAYR
jgi:hypothetical protein